MFMLAMFIMWLYYKISQTFVIEQFILNSYDIEVDFMCISGFLKEKHLKLKEIDCAL